MFSNQILAQAEWDMKVLEAANTAKEISHLSQEEKSIIFYTNLVRMNAPLFAETYLKSYLEKNNISNNKWVVSLKKDLKKAPLMSPLEPQEDLYEAARNHAEKSGKTGRTGHFDFNERTKELMKKYDEIGENCEYGSANGLSVVMNLLIDEKVSNLGHRKNILNAEFKYLGTSIQKHKKWGFNSVIIYGREIKNPPAR